MRKKKRSNINVELWNIKGQKRRFFVARTDKGTLIEKRPVKGSKLLKQDAIKEFKETGSFYVGVEKKRTKLTNVKEYVQIKESSLDNRNKKIVFSKPTGKVIQYIVQGRYKNKKIVARSQAIGEKFAKDSRMAKDEAWNNFIKLINHSENQDYDNNENVDLDKVTDIREGWVVYR